MSFLSNSRRERFVQGVISGATATAAYIAAGYSNNGAAQSAQRLLRNPEIRGRKGELEKKVVVEFVAGQIAERQYRLAVLQDLVDRLRAVIDDRAVAYKDVTPGGASGLLTRRVRMIGTGKNARRIEEYTFDRAVVTEILKSLKQAAIEVGEWGQKPSPEVSQLPDLSHLTPEQLFAEQRIWREAHERVAALHEGRPDPLMIEAGRQL